ncbi:sensor histidine kinase [Streptomyces sp. NPDC058964]|uniref:sensor histidine kinase n=1 Tax=Streptomyces sp. NPDC058964 TaxID=3346681 RepID=UPI00369F81FC
MKDTKEMRWPWWAESVMVGAVSVLSALDAVLASGGSHVTVVVGVALLGAGAVAFRRRRPMPSAVVATAVAGEYGLILPLLVVVFEFTVRGRGRQAVCCAAVATVLNVFGRTQLSVWASRSYGSALLLALVLTLGMWAGNRRRLADALAAQLDHLRTERDLRERATRLSERTAIAAEMHDVLAHRLSLIALHTGVLANRSDALPAPVVERLALLRTASTEALNDLRDVLGALRTPGHSERVQDRAPALRQVDDLIEQARAAGQHVEAAVDGRPEHVPAAHRLAVFRLVQEALTNARKHAGNAPVTLHVHYGPPAVEVKVTNATGRRVERPAPSGFGLVGLRERVEALGGSLHAGRAGDGAWHLLARIPHSAIGQNGPLS